MKKYEMRSSVQKHVEEMLKKDPQFKKEYELSRMKSDLVLPMIRERIRRGWTQGELARRVKVSQQQISKIENLDFSEFGTVLKVLRALGYTILPSKKPHLSPKARAA